jgi:hypothetical protein
MLCHPWNYQTTWQFRIYSWHCCPCGLIGDIELRFGLTTISKSNNRASNAYKVLREREIRSILTAPGGVSLRGINTLERGVCYCCFGDSAELQQSSKTLILSGLSRRVKLWSWSCSVLIRVVLRGVGQVFACECYTRYPLAINYY